MSFCFREGTLDSIIFDEVCICNEYELPEIFSQDDIIIDVGAHVGFFVNAVIQRGAKNIYAVEADIENYKIAAIHLKDYIDQTIVTLTWGAVWRSDTHEEVLFHSGYPLLSSTRLINTGGGNVIWQKQGNAIPVIPFDTLVSQATDHGRKSVRLLKIDCEGSEWPILFTSKTLYLVEEICGEFHELGGMYDAHHPPFSIPNHENWTIHHLLLFLEQQDFEVHYSRHLKHDGTPSCLGLFFAKRRREQGGDQTT